MNYRRGNYAQSPLYMHLILCGMQYLPPTVAQKTPQGPIALSDQHKLEAEIPRNIGSRTTSKELGTSSQSGTLNLSLALPRTEIHNSKVTTLSCQASLSCKDSCCLVEKHSCYRTVGVTPKESKLPSPPHCPVQKMTTSKCYF